MTFDIKFIYVVKLSRKIFFLEIQPHSYFNKTIWLFSNKIVLKILKAITVNVIPEDSIIIFAFYLHGNKIQENILISPSLETEYVDFREKYWRYQRT